MGWLYDEKFHLFTNASQGHLVITKKNFRDLEFFQHCESSIKNIQYLPNLAPFLISKKEDYDSQIIGKTIKTLIHFENRSEALSRLEHSAIMQQYIYPLGGKASVIRFLYHNPKIYSSKQLN